MKNSPGESEAHRASFRLGSLFKGSGIGLDKIAHRTNDDITQRDIGMVGDRLKHIFFVRGNPDSHNPIASFWHVKKLVQYSI